jgi:precorrin-6B methylase 1
MSPSTKIIAKTIIDSGVDFQRNILIQSNLWVADQLFRDNLGAALSQEKFSKISQ